MKIKILSFFALLCLTVNSAWAYTVTWHSEELANIDIDGNGDWTYEGSGDITAHAWDDGEATWCYSNITIEGNGSDNYIWFNIMPIPNPGGEEIERFITSIVIYASSIEGTAKDYWDNEWVREYDDIGGFYTLRWTGNETNVNLYSAHLYITGITQVVFEIEEEEGGGGGGSHDWQLVDEDWYPHGAEISLGDVDHITCTAVFHCDHCDEERYIPLSVYYDDIEYPTCENEGFVNVYTEGFDDPDGNYYGVLNNWYYIARSSHVLADYTIDNSAGDIEYWECGYCFRKFSNSSAISETFTFALNQDADNGNVISTLDGCSANVTLNRTLQAGGWNTFCAPFNISSSQITSVFGEGTKVRELGSSELEGTALTLNFTEATSIRVGKPYLVYLGSGSNVVNPTFNGVTIIDGTTTKSTTYADFVPVMNPTNLTGGDKTVLFVTGGDKLTYPADDGNINGFRAYFQLKNGAAAARAFTMSFDDEETGITTVLSGEPTTGSGTYTLDGRRINGQPTQKGLYIVNGKKTIIK